MRRRRAIVMLGLGLLGASCAPRYYRAYDPAWRDRIRRIGLLTPGVSDAVAVRIEVHPGLSLGVIGMLVAASDMGGKSVQFKHATRREGFVGRHAMIEALNAGLVEAGYEVHAIAVARSPDADGFLAGYPPSDDSVDAYLDVDCDLVGYAAAGGGTPYRPAVHLNARLVRAGDHTTVYQDRIAYHALGDGDGAITLTPAPGYAFDTFDALIADPTKAVEGLRLAMFSTAQALARQLR